MNYGCFMLIVGFAMIVQSPVVTGVGPLARIIQSNLVGLPVIHQNTQWDFDPEQGKLRRELFERLNGKRGEDLISRLGNGMNIDGPWGIKVSGSKPNTRYYLQS